MRRIALIPPLALFSCVGAGSAVDTAGDCRPVVSAGFEVGARPPEVELVDQFGDRACSSSIWEPLGVLHVRPEFPVGCQGITEDIGAIETAFDSPGLVYATLLSSDMDGDTPDVSDLLNFADYHELDAPVLADPSGVFTQEALRDASSMFYVLGVNSMVLASTSCYTTEGLCAAVSEALSLEVPISCVEE